MWSGRRTLTVLAFIVLAPLAAAANLDGALRWDEPAISIGVLAPVPLGGIAQTTVWPEANAAQERPRVVESSHLRATVYQWFDNGPLAQARVTTQTWELHDASIYIEELHKRGTIDVRQDAGRHTSGAQTLLAVTECEINRAMGTAQSPLPVRPVPSPQGEAFMLTRCDFTGLTSHDPDRMVFNGMRLVIESREGSYTVDTGNAQAPSLEQQPGDATMAFRATSLEIEPLGAPLDARLAFDGDAILIAPAFLVVGGLTVPSSHGELQWGDRQEAGEVKPFSAKGEFLLTARRDGHVEVSGQSLDEPQPVLASAAAGRADGAATAVALVLAPLVALPFAIRFLVALWARHSGDRVLEHPRRASIYQMVERAPGIEVATIGRQLGIRPAKMHYHVRVLEHAGRVSLHRVAGRTSLFPTGMGYRGRELPIALARRQPMARILDVLRTEPGLDQESLARRLELGQPQVSRHLSRLEEAHVVESRVALRRRRYYLAQAAAAPYAEPSAHVATP